MGDRRREVLDAAIDVLGTGGLRRLTYQAVDAAAGVPSGTTSRHFRTREALIDGMVEHLVTLDREDWEGGGVAGGGYPLPTGREEFALALARMVRQLVGPGRNRNNARYQLLLEGVVRPSVREPLEGARAALLGWGTDLLRDLGSPTPREHCKTLFALLDGMMLQQLTLAEDDFDPLPSIRTMVHAILPQDGPGAQGATPGAQGATPGAQRAREAQGSRETQDAPEAHGVRAKGDGSGGARAGRAAQAARDAQESHGAAGSRAGSAEA